MSMPLSAAISCTRARALSSSVPKSRTCVKAARCVSLSRSLSLQALAHANGGCQLLDYKMPNKGFPSRFLVLQNCRRVLSLGLQQSPVGAHGRSGMLLIAGLCSSVSMFLLPSDGYCSCFKCIGSGVRSAGEAMCEQLNGSLMGMVACTYLILCGWSCWLDALLPFVTSSV